MGAIEPLASGPTPSATDPDRILVLRAQRDLPAESTSYRTLVERHRPALFRRACRILGSSADAEEAVQEAFLRVFWALPSYRPERPFAHWLSVILLNTCRTILRQRAQEQRRRDALRASGELSDSDSSLVGDPILSGVIRGLLEELPASTRAAIWMRTIEGRPHSEIAAKLKLSESAVKMRIHRGRAELRARYLQCVDRCVDAQPLPQPA